MIRRLSWGDLVVHDSVADRLPNSALLTEESAPDLVDTLG